jgi:parallel beta-helix repeat protein
MKICFVWWIIFLFTASLWATNYYVDPASGNIDNTGDKEHPWDTLEQVFKSRKSIAAGDTLFLLNGHHGAPIVRGNNADFAVITSFQDHQPSCTKISFSGAAKWHVSNLVISPEKSSAYTKETLISITSSASEIIVENCFGYSVLDNSSWSQTDWSQNSCTGAVIEGDKNTLRSNHFLNVKHGILVEMTGEHNLVDGNIVENFAADGMRGIGSYNTFQYNTVKNCYDVDDNHDDGFQSYSRSSDGVGKTTVYGIVLRGNTIINYTDPNQKFRGSLQGIGCFDGMFEDWIIENNVVIVDTWHGISLYGARNCKIVNNTVIDPNETSPGPPWIKITAHKNGTKSTNNIIKNNLTTSMANDADIGDVAYNWSILFNAYDNYFTDYRQADLSLKEDARPINRGTDEDAATHDILGTPRPQGDGYDLGAYEYIFDTGFSTDNVQTPARFELSNYPNPFNPVTMIEYRIPQPSHIKLSIYNLCSKHVSTLVNAWQNAGEHHITFDADGLPSGVYLCKISLDNNEHVHKLILQK